MQNQPITAISPVKGYEKVLFVIEAESLPPSSGATEQGASIHTICLWVRYSFLPIQSVIVIDHKI